MKGTRILVGILAAAGLACSTVKTSSDWDRGEDFSRYRSFAFREGHPVRATFVQKRIEDAISRTLRSKGLTPASSPDSADLLIYTHARTRTQRTWNVDRFGYGGWWGRRWWGGGWGPYGGARTVTEQDIRIGTLVVDVVDASKNAVVWRGTATATIDEKSGDPDRIQKAIDKLFTDFPRGVSGA